METNMTTTRRRLNGRAKTASGLAGLFLVIGLAAGCSSGPSAAPIIPPTPAKGQPASVSSVATTTTLPECGSSRDPLDPQATGGAASTC
jgi:hypothetical protein